MQNYVYLCTIQPLDQVGTQRIMRVVAVEKAGGGIMESSNPDQRVLISFEIKRSTIYEI